MNKTLLLTLAILVTLSTYVTPIQALSVTPPTKSYTVNQEDLIIDEITYKNDSKATETITLTVSAYDAKTEKALTDKPFVTLKKTSYTLKPKQQVKIPYVIAIPKETPMGSYFNVIYIEKKEKKKDNTNVSIIPSLGVLLSFHIQSSSVSINQLFYNQSDITITVKKKGLPYLFPTEFEYTYKNNSNFVFKPEGEIRILDSNDQQLLDRFEINKDKKAIYPGESFTQTYSVNLWDDVKSVLGSKNIVSKTYSDIDQTPVLNKVTITILYQSILISTIAAILVISLLAILISSLISMIKARKEKVPAK